MTFFLWILAICIALILLSFDVAGEDLYGIYGAKPFTSFWLYLIYLAAGSYAVASYFVTYYFYGKLQKFIRENKSTR